MIASNRHPTSALLCLLLTVIVALPAAAQRDLDPTRWQDAMQRFDAQDRENPPPANAIVLTGSSSIARWNEQSVAALAPLPAPGPLEGLANRMAVRTR